MEAMIGILVYLIAYPIIFLLLKFIEYKLGGPTAIIFGLFLLILVVIIICIDISKSEEE